MDSSKDSQAFDIPIVMIVFNRPEKTNKVLKQVSKIRPKKLLVVADGPRKDVKSDTNLVEKVRAFFDQLDWPCELIINFADHNMGRKMRISSGVKWAFSEVDEAIFLKDDYLPDLSFFPFCKELLIKYRNSPEILMISGHNFLGKTKLNESYYFSKYPTTTCWASWKRAWEHYDVHLKDWANTKKSNFKGRFKLFQTEKAYWTECFDQVIKKEKDIWNIQIYYMAFKFKVYTITPTINLVEHLPSVEEETDPEHYVIHENPSIKGKITFPLVHPPDGLIKVNTYLDRIRQSKEFHRPIFYQKILDKLKQKFQRSHKIIS